MSKIGRKVIRVPENIQLFIQNNCLTLQNHHKIIKMKIPNIFILEYKENNLFINISPFFFKKMKEPRQISMLWGTFRSFLNNQIVGLSQGFQISLKMIGVGYKMSIENQFLNLKIGFSHIVSIPIPKNIKIVLTKMNQMTIQSDDKNSLLQF